MRNKRNHRKENMLTINNNAYKLIDWPQMN